MCNEVAVSQFELIYRQMSGRAEEAHCWGKLEDKKVFKMRYLEFPQHNFDVQLTTYLFGKTCVCEPKETTSSTSFRYEA